jgi:hypothetical protein
VVVAYRVHAIHFGWRTHACADEQLPAAKARSASNDTAIACNGVEVSGPAKSMCSDGSRVDLFSSYSLYSVY